MTHGVMRTRQQAITAADAADLAAPMTPEEAADVASDVPALVALWLATWRPKRGRSRVWMGRALATFRAWAGPLATWAADGDVRAAMRRALPAGVVVASGQSLALTVAGAEHLRTGRRRPLSQAAGVARRTAAWRRRQGEALRAAERERWRRRQAAKRSAVDGCSPGMAG